MAEESGGYGQQSPFDFSNKFNTEEFLIRQALARISTAKLVKVLAVDTDAKTIDCQPLVAQLDGIGNSTPQPQVFAIPYLYFQCGNGAVIADPVVGDKGLAVFCDRDNSAVLATKDFANPGSYRKLDIADGIYICGLPGINDAPEQFVKFTSTGLDLEDKNGNKLTSGAAGWTFTGNVIFQGNLQLGGAIKAQDGTEYTQDISTKGRVIASDVFAPSTAGGVFVSLHGHIHPANNTPPTPGH